MTSHEDVELGVWTTACVNHAYVEGGEELDPPEQLHDSASTTPRYDVTPEERSRVLRNVGTLSFAFLCVFMGKYGVGNLQSSLNRAQGLGPASLAATYLGLVVSNATLPGVALKSLGCKWTLALGCLLCIPYVGLQAHPRFATLLPAALLAGVSGAPLGVAANKYLAVTAEVYSDITGTPVDLVIPKFFGVFLLFCQMAQVWGNLATSLIMTGYEPPLNASQERLVLETCGIAFCPPGSLGNPNLNRPDEETLLIVVYVFIGALVVAAIIMLSGIDSISRYSDGHEETSGVAGFRLLGATFRELRKERSLQLMVPITFWLGLEQAFMSSDYTAAYVACAWGLADLGYVMMGYGVTNALCSLLIGWFTKATGRAPALVSAFALHIVIIATLLFWHPDPGQTVVFFVITLLWGAADAIWVVQIISLYGGLSPGKEEAAFSNYDLWLSVGFITGFASSAVVCAGVKLYVMLATLLLGMAAYLFLEFTQVTREKDK